jgi:hypothetical protein
MGVAPTAPTPPVPLLGIGDGNGVLYAGLRAFALPAGWTLEPLPQGTLAGLSGSGGQLTGYFQAHAPASASSAYRSLYSGGGGDGPPGFSTTALASGPAGLAFRTVQPPASSPLPGATKVIFSVDLWPANAGGSGYAALASLTTGSPVAIASSVIAAPPGSGPVSLTADITAWALGLTVATPIVLLLWSDAPTSTVAVGSNGVSLPTSTIDLVSADGFNSNGGSGTITGTGISGSTTVTYGGTSNSPQSLQSCSGGSGTLNTGDVVTGTVGVGAFLSQAEIIYSL